MQRCKDKNAPQTLSTATKKQDTSKAAGVATLIKPNEPVSVQLTPPVRSNVSFLQLVKWYREKRCVWLRTPTRNASGYILPKNQEDRGRRLVTAPLPPSCDCFASPNQRLTRRPSATPPTALFHVGFVVGVCAESELGEWMKACLEGHPMFEALPDEELEADPVVKLLSGATEEGQKVARNGGQTFQAVFRRIVLSV
ncbi:hypothetical protein HYC85_010368 [Camellia sinensis]|uniref:Uncharacterized protein n=1 Tax=Camellia sinensis TaxID=4442 RepID=A0A7J7HKB8_CAMSI|nr:hypothetical protein HYC85_010368 [Camellia sinensis]